MYCAIYLKCVCVCVCTSYMHICVGGGLCIFFSLFYYLFYIYNIVLHLTSPRYDNIGQVAGIIYFYGDIRDLFDP